MSVIEEFFLGGGMEAPPHCTPLQGSVRANRPPTGLMGRNAASLIYLYFFYTNAFILLSAIFFSF